MKKLKTLRRISQIFFLCVFVYILWSTTYPLEGAIPPGSIFKVDPNVMIFTSISERIMLPGIIPALLMLIITAILGRFFCGWVCPLGSVIDSSAALKKKKKRLSDDVNSRVKLPKFLILLVILFFSAFGIQIAWVLDPLVIAARFVSLNLIPTVTLSADKVFMLTIQKFDLYNGAVYDFYRMLRSSVLGVKVAYFNNAGIIFVVFLLIYLSALLIPRIWCRALCPLGAIYALTSKISILKRRVVKCTDCGRCAAKCRMGAIKNDMSYNSGECVLCMDCVYECPVHGTKFTFLPGVPKNRDEAQKGISRKDFLFLLFGAVTALGFKWPGQKSRKRQNDIIRPPGALMEKAFLSRCVRCGNCKKVCPTNGLQPALLQAGIEGIWTPHLVPEIGYCEYNCMLCGHVCPTGAIPKLALKDKKRAKLGVAKVDHTTCLAWGQGQECLVCEEHCPIPDKAIKVVNDRVGGKLIDKPVVDRSLCIGCGICQNKCPVRPKRAIIVDPEYADRTKIRKV